MAGFRHIEKKDGTSNGLSIVYVIRGRIIILFFYIWDFEVCDVICGVYIFNG